MKSMHIFKSLFALTATSLLISLTACDKSTPVSPETTDLESSEYSVYELEDEFAGITDATLESDMSLAKDAPTDYKALDRNRHNKRFQQRRHYPGLHLHMALDSLNLSEEQRNQVVEFLGQYRECISEPITAFRTEAQSIIDDAKVQRQALRDSLIAGVITREEARAQIQVINQEKRQEMQTLAETLGLQDAICACREVLLQDILSILDETQAATFQLWLDARQGPCVQTADSE